MLTKKNLALDKKLLSPLVFDYISKKEELKPFYTHFPDSNGFTELLSDKKLFSGLNRELLSRVLKDQSMMITNTTSASQKNIKSLTDQNTFTVTTGHQLCLFTGPLYFIYKIYSVINLCEKLKHDFPQHNFVPVYWMATEDHDAEEINHFNLFGKKIVWETEQKGAVGNFSNEGLDKVYKQLEEIVGKGPNAESILELFEKCYLKQSDLTAATRYLVNELFGEYGIVIADGNSEELKKEFIPFFKKDIFENIPNKKVSETISALSKLGYESQVNPREINCFYLDKNVRARIEKEGESYLVVGTDKVFSKKEVENIIETQTQKISPNVVLRPVYQQSILPNIAYVGGPGELAYWLEYKNMFAELGVTFPVLVPRKMVSIFDEATLQKVEKLGFEAKDFFEEEQTLIKNYLQKNNLDFSANKVKKQIEDIFSKLNTDASGIDKTLAGAVEAEKQKTMNSISMIEGKVNRALKQKSDNELNQIKGVKSKLYPNGVLQERHDNFTMYFLKWGVEFLKFLKWNLDYDLKSNETIIVEEK